MTNKTPQEINTSSSTPTKIEVWYRRLAERKKDRTEGKKGGAKSGRRPLTMTMSEVVGVMYLIWTMDMNRGMWSFWAPMKNNLKETHPRSSSVSELDHGHEQRRVVVLGTDEEQPERNTPKVIICQ